MKTDELYREDYRSLPWCRRLLWLYYWYSWRLVTWLGARLGRRYWWNGGRHTDGDPTVCEECLRVFRVRDCVHTYQACGYDDVEGLEECPHCGHEI